MVRSRMEAPLIVDQRYVEIARTLSEPRGASCSHASVEAIDTLHRHHVETIARRYIGSSPSAANVVPLAVGFADMSGYTGISTRLDAEKLGIMLDRFEATPVMSSPLSGANIVKRIGDAVMYVTNAPGVACTLGLDLVDACAAARLPKLRVGVAFGDVIVRQGDFYGATVNLAARLVAAADPGTVLADAELHARLGGIRGRVHVPAGRTAHVVGVRRPGRGVPAASPVADARPSRSRELQRCRSPTVAARLGLRTAQPAAPRGRRPIPGRARRRARSSRPPLRGSVRNTRTARPLALRVTADTSAPSTRSARPDAGTRPPGRRPVHVRTGRGTRRPRRSSRPRASRRDGGRRRTRTRCPPSIWAPLTSTGGPAGFGRSDGSERESQPVARSSVSASSLPSSTTSYSSSPSWSERAAGVAVGRVDEPARREGRQVRTRACRPRRSGPGARR